jgi:hypothetical protein
VYSTVDATVRALIDHPFEDFELWSHPLVATSTNQAELPGPPPRGPPKLVIAYGGL